MCFSALTRDACSKPKKATWQCFCTAVLENCANNSKNERASGIVQATFLQQGSVRWVKMFSILNYGCEIVLKSKLAAVHLLHIWIRLDVLVAVAELDSQFSLVHVNLTSDSDGNEDEINEMMVEIVIGCMSALQTSGAIGIALPRE